MIVIFYKNLLQDLEKRRMADPMDLVADSYTQ